MKILCALVNTVMYYVCSCMLLLVKISRSMVCPKGGDIEFLVDFSNMYVCTCKCTLSCHTHS